MYTEYAENKYTCTKSAYKNMVHKKRINNARVPDNGQHNIETRSERRAVSESNPNALVCDWYFAMENTFFWLTC